MGRAGFPNLTCNNGTGDIVWFWRQQLIILKGRLYLIAVVFCAIVKLEHPVAVLGFVVEPRFFIIRDKSGTVLCQRFSSFLPSSGIEILRRRQQLWNSVILSRSACILFNSMVSMVWWVFNNTEGVRSSSLTIFHFNEPFLWGGEPTEWRVKEKGWRRRGVLWWLFWWRSDLLTNEKWPMRLIKVDTNTQAHCGWHCWQGFRLTLDTQAHCG